MHCDNNKKTEDCESQKASALLSHSLSSWFNKTHIVWSHFHPHIAFWQLFGTECGPHVTLQWLITNAVFLAAKHQYAAAFHEWTVHYGQLQPWIHESLFSEIFYHHMSAGIEHHHPKMITAKKLFSLISFQTCMILFLMWKSKDLIWRNLSVFVS